MSQLFKSPTKGELVFDDVVGDVLEFISTSGDKKIIIGTDSQGTGDVDFVTAIIIHHVGRGARYFWTKKNGKYINSLRQKIYQETSLSLFWAQQLLAHLQEDWNPEFLSEELEIHIDVGERGPTRDLIKEVVGMIRGNGFNAKTKPES